MDKNKSEIAPVLKNRNFLLLFQGSLTSSIAATLYSFALSFYILEITENNAAMQGTYLFVCGLVYVLTSFIGGVLADRWNKEKIVYGSDFLKGTFILISMCFLILFIRHNTVASQLAVLFVVGVVNNILAAVFMPASTALLPEIVTNEQLMKANALFSVQNNLISILGMILAAVLYSFFSITTLFCIIGVLYVISGITELFIKVEYVKKDEHLTVKAVIGDFVDGLKYVAELKPILYVIISALVLNFFATPLASNILPYIIKTDIAKSNYVLREFLTPESWSAVFMLILGIGSIVMSIIMGNRKETSSVGKSIKIWIALTSLTLFAFAASYTFFVHRDINVFLILAMAEFLFIGVGLVGINLPVNVVLQRDVQKDMMAKVNSIMNIGASGLTPIASLIAGILLNQFNAGVLAFFCAGGLIVATIFVCCSKNIAKL